MQLNDKGKFDLAEEIAAWQDVSQWALLPKSLIISVIKGQARAISIYRSLEPLASDVIADLPEQKAENIKSSPLSSELLKEIQKAKQEAVKTWLLLKYFAEHAELLEKQAVGDLWISFVQQLHARIPEDNLVAFIANVVGASEQPKS